jgi:hypothetical protein
MNRILKIGDRVRNVRDIQYKDESVVIVGESDNNNSLKIKFNRYHIKYLNVFTVSEDNMMSWVDENDIVLDIEYYRNEKLNKILGYEVT